MYGFKAEICERITVFEGRTLELICLSENTISLHFSGNVSLNVLGGLSQLPGQAGADSRHLVDIPPSSTDLPVLLGKKVVIARCQTQFELELVFESGGSLVLEDSREYETCQLQIGTDTFFV